MRFLPIFSKNLVGLDVQAHEIKLVLVRKIRKKFYVEQVASAQLLSKNKEEMSVVLMELVQTLGLKNHIAVFSLPANMVRTQHLQLPIGMSPAEIEMEIAAQVGSDFPGLSETVAIDFSVFPHQEPGYSDIFYVIAKQELIAQYVKNINASGLKLKIIDVDIYALHRVLSGILVSEIETIVCVLGHHIWFFVANKQEIIFHQQWNLTTSIELEAQIKQRIQMFTTLFPHKKIHKIGVYSENFRVDIASYETYELQPLINLSELVSAKFQNKSLAAYLIACGSAMRDRPLW